jgi:hypothetical protein
MHIDDSGPRGGQNQVVEADESYLDAKPRNRKRTSKTKAWIDLGSLSQGTPACLNFCHKLVLQTPSNGPVGGARSRASATVGKFRHMFRNTQWVAAHFRPIRDHMAQRHRESHRFAWSAPVQRVPAKSRTET